MPQNSGGGSHFGGFHSSSSNYRHSHHYFYGAQRYRYFDRGGQPHYLYANQKPYGLSEVGLFAVILISILVSIGILYSL